MRITREALMKVVRDTVSRQVRTTRGLVSIYLCGSLLEDEYLLGGTADIDLVMIHTEKPEADREIIRLTDEVHLDIAHHQHKDYRQTRRLRIHPWLGPTLNKCQILHDPQHFMDFTQASVRGQFDRSDHVLERGRLQVEHARQIWQSYQLEDREPGVKEVSDYLRAVEHVVNGVASLSGPPLTERRFLLNFPARAEAVGRPGLHAGLLGLLGAPHVDDESLRALLPLWKSAYQALASAGAPARLHPARLLYYRKAFEAMLDSGHSQAILWPLLRTWTFIMRELPDNSPERASWRQSFQFLGLLGEEFYQRIDALDAYLDQAEDTLEAWAEANGA